MLHVDCDEFFLQVRVRTLREEYTDPNVIAMHKLLPLTRPRQGKRRGGLGMQSMTAR